jgi:hypothetical protein
MPYDNKASHDPTLEFTECGYRLNVPLENLSLIWRRHHCRGDLGLFSALRAGIFIVPHLLWNGVSVFPASSEGKSQLVASYETQFFVQEDDEDLF